VLVIDCEPFESGAAVGTGIAKLNGPASVSTDWKPDVPVDADIGAKWIRLIEIES